ncbi:hypothetical protein [Geodermatophilus sabuli]|nr:hypothetical protein [Geodermatophilus sabuli]MBB3082523.1 hypothetical protein [Geodermatophilus sabuli]
MVVGGTGATAATGRVENSLAILIFGVLDNVIVGIDGACLRPGALMTAA